jgi:hypothetical protein
VSEPTYSREVLVDLCERAAVPVDHWHDRDSAGAQKQVGEALMLLKAGCDFSMSEDPVTDEKTVWIRVVYPGFNAFECGRDRADGYWDDDTFYIPTNVRLARSEGKDWY